MLKELFYTFLVYVDCIVLTGNNTTFVAHFINILCTKFTLKDMSLLNHFLGIEVISTSTRLFLSQLQYISDILTQFHMKMPRQFLRLCPLLIGYLGQSRPRHLIYLGIIGYLVSFSITHLLVWIFLLQ
ncbi:hypothetical protein GQ457_13G012960 [Hibiscus cannabinus]